MSLKIYVPNEIGDKCAALTNEQFGIVELVIVDMMNGIMSAKAAEAKVRAMLAESAHPITDKQWEPMPAKRKKRKR